MTFLRHPRALACLALAALLSTAAHARPADGHPAVPQALAHLKAEAERSGAASAHGWRFRDLIVDADDSTHVRFARDYRGLPVIGGDLVVHQDNLGALRAMSRTLRDMPALSTRPRVDAAAAIAAARVAFGAEPFVAPTAKLSVYARGGQPRLAWDVKMIGMADGRPSRARLIVDARTATLVDRWDDLQTVDAVGTSVSLHSGTVSIHADHQADGTFALRDTTRGSHEVYNLNGKNGFLDVLTKGTLMTDADNAWGDGLVSKTSQSDGVDAQYGQSVTWDFYKRLGRNGIADDGRGAFSRVHSGTGPFNIFYNAGWSDDCFCMTYSNGLNADNKPLVSLDVVGHEMTHGVTSNTAGLIYAGESGGLNEATSDIMGSMVEAFARNANDPADFLIGEQIFPDSPLRSMVQPSSDGVSADCWYAGVGNLDVHYSSGVANHFFYLLSEGSQTVGKPASPTCNAGDTRVASGNAVVQGVGRVAATRIWYRALTVYMTSDTDHAGARAATVSAATDLFGASSTQVQRVQAAWSAVNVN